MKLIIDIDKKKYEEIKRIAKAQFELTDKTEAQIIANGIPYEERPQGEWSWSGNNGNGRNYYNCSVCGRLIEANREELINFPFCHCGAKMRGGSE